MICTFGIAHPKEFSGSTEDNYEMKDLEFERN